METTSGTQPGLQPVARPLSSLSLLAQRLDQSSLDDDDQLRSHLESVDWAGPTSSLANQKMFKIAESENNYAESFLTVFPPDSACITKPATATATTFPAKRQCRSLGVAEGLARPIAIRPNFPDLDADSSPSPSSSNIDDQDVSSDSITSTATPSTSANKSNAGQSFSAPQTLGKVSSRHGWLFLSRVSGQSHLHQHSHNCHHLQQKMVRASPCSYARPLTSPYSTRSRSAFTPTRRLISPQTSSDYSISPDVDSPVQRPASVSSGFHDASLQSLVETCSLPDCSQSCRLTGRISQPPCNHPQQHTSTPPKIPAQKARCRSQPTLEPSQQLCGCWCSRPLPLKRRYDMTLLPSSQSCCTGRAGTPHTTQQMSPLAHIPLIDDRKKPISNDVFFFGSNRPYLVSLPGIACSPPMPSMGGNCHSSTRKTWTLPAHHKTSGGSGTGGRGSQASTLTASSTGTPTNSNSRELLPGHFTGEHSSEMDQSTAEPRPTTDEDDYDPELDMDLVEGENNSSDSSTNASLSDDDHTSSTRKKDSLYSQSSTSGITSGFCFRPVAPLPQEPPFQELDLDQIEND